MGFFSLFSLFWQKEEDIVVMTQGNFILKTIILPN